MSTGTDHPPPSVILVDFDGTLAEYHGFEGVNALGEPILRMVAKVRRWLQEGKDIRIFTARVAYGEPPTNEVPFRTTRATAQRQRELIEQWCLRHLGAILPVTCSKGYNTALILDDRCEEVLANTGMTLREWFEEAKVSRPPRCFRGPATLRRPS